MLSFLKAAFWTASDLLLTLLASDWLLLEVEEAPDSSDWLLAPDESSELENDAEYGSL